MENRQPAERITSEPEWIDVVSVWHTIQGEGPYAGMPAVFVRLAGCQYKCRLCDTNYTTGRKLLSVADVANTVREAHGTHPCRLVVLTGGEPFRQDLSFLVPELVDAGYRVQIETNGGLAYDHFPWVDATIVVSPKSSFVDPRIKVHARAWKYVVEAGYINDSGFPTRILGVPVPNVPVPSADTPKSSIYIQPLDEGDEHKNRMHYNAATGVCLIHGYRLSLQMHKIVGLS